MDPTALRDRIIQKALELGADDAGVCLASDLLTGPTHSRFPLPEGIEKQSSIVVLALSHPPDKPELDYFVRRDGFRFGNSEGNRRLMEISSHIGQWLQDEGIASRDLHYYVEMGGVFLKGAAVLAGLGTIGLNNLLIHPGYGTRIRFRAHLIDRHIAPSDSLDFDPCRECPKPCFEICSEGALYKGEYLSRICQERFDRDYEEGITLPAVGDRPAIREVHYCRDCEFSCAYRGSMEKTV